MVKLLSIVLCAATSTQALWLAVHSGPQNGAQWCSVGRGDTQQQAEANAANPKASSRLINNSRCGRTRSVKTSQKGGFWDDYGTINYIDSNWHWYCDIDTTGDRSGSCDAQGGAPRKREVAFDA